MNDIIFFVGTAAEMIKLFPVIKELEKRDYSYYIIASGQNNLLDSSLLIKANGNRLDLLLSDEMEIKKTGFGLFQWWVKTFTKGKRALRKFIDDKGLENPVIVVHGDTVSTVMGAMIGKLNNCKVAHVEAGLRSFNIMNPFPEELDRIITSGFSDIHFAPGKWACGNIKKKKTEVIDTVYNTAIDSLAYAKNMVCENHDIIQLAQTEYFVFVIHRQENLMNKEFVLGIINNIRKISCKMKAVIILHKITEIAFQNFGIMNGLETDENIVLLPRQDYFDFINLLANSRFVISDGGSNQEELSYLGKPCMIIRKVTERKEGIGSNAVLFDGDPDSLIRFFSEYSRYEALPVIPTLSPSQIIADRLTGCAER